MAIMIDTGTEVSILRRGLFRTKDLTTIPETIRLKTVTEESTGIIGEAEVDICIGQLKKKHRRVGMDFISCYGLTIDPVIQ